MKCIFFVLANLIVFNSASDYNDGGSNSGYTYGVGQNNGIGHRYTDFIHSNKHESYSQPEAFADIKTIKVIHEQGGSSSGSGYGGIHGGGYGSDYASQGSLSAVNSGAYDATSSSIGGYGEKNGLVSSSVDSYGGSHSSANNFNAASAPIASYNAIPSSGSSYTNHAPTSGFVELSGGYTTGLGNYASNGHKNEENVKVIRVIHEYSTPSGRSHSYSKSQGHRPKTKTSKTIKVVHEFNPSAKYSGSGSSSNFDHSSGGNGAKTLKIVHEKVQPSYVPYDHLNAYNGGSNNGGFSDSFETLKSLKAIGIFSNLGSPTSVKNGHSATNAQYLPSLRESFPPINTSGGWLKKK